MALSSSRNFRVLSCLMCVLIVGGWDGCFPKGSQTGNSTYGCFPLNTETDYVDRQFPLIVYGSFPHPKTRITGNWEQDFTAAVGSTRSFDTYTDEDGLGFVSGGRIHSTWSSRVQWAYPGQPDRACGFDYAQQDEFYDVGPYTGIGWVCIRWVDADPFGIQHFVRIGASMPTSIDVGGSGLTSTYGMPKLNFYNRQGLLAGSSVATSLAADGSAATFPMPSLTNPDLYGVAVLNYDSAGQSADAADHYIAIGKDDTSYTTPFGVDIGVIDYQRSMCNIYNPDGCTDTETVSVVPMVTQYSTNQLVYQSHLVGVGTHPGPVLAYRIITSHTYTSSAKTSTSTTITQPTRAIVANMGSGTVSILDLVGYSNLATINVGNQPTAIVLNSDQSKAYVAAYADGNVLEINLNTNAVSRTLHVGTNPISLTMDPSGNSLWVGELNQIAKVDLSTFAVASAIPQSGLVNTLVASSGQNKLLYTTVQGGNSLPYGAYGSQSTSSGFTIADVSMVDNSTTTTYSQSSSSSYQSYSMAGTLPNVSVVPTGARLSKKYSNSLGVVSTPDGFAVVSLISGTVLWQVQTPTPVRAIAASQDQQVAYVALPDSNLLIKVPLPNQLGN